jgi:hypothetical protein
MVPPSRGRGGRIMARDGHPRYGSVTGAVAGAVEAAQRRWGGISLIRSVARWGAPRSKVPIQML